MPGSSAPPPGGLGLGRGSPWLAARARAQALARQARHVEAEAEAEAEAPPRQKRKRTPAASAPDLLRRLAAEASTGAGAGDVPRALVVAAEAAFRTAARAAERGAEPPDAEAEAVASLCLTGPGGGRGGVPAADVLELLLGRLEADPRRIRDRDLCQLALAALRAALRRRSAPPAPLAGPSLLCRVAVVAALLAPPRTVGGQADAGGGTAPTSDGDADLEEVHLRLGEGLAALLKAELFPPARTRALLKLGRAFLAGRPKPKPAAGREEDGDGETEEEEEDEEEGAGRRALEAATATVEAALAAGSFPAAGRAGVWETVCLAFEEAAGQLRRLDAGSLVAERVGEMDHRRAVAGVVLALLTRQCEALRAALEVDGGRGAAEAARDLVGALRWLEARREAVQALSHYTSGAFEHLVTTLAAAVGAASAHGGNPEVLAGVSAPRLPRRSPMLRTVTD